MNPNSETIEFGPTRTYQIRGSKEVLANRNFPRFLPNRPRRLSSFDTHVRWQPVTQSARSRRSYGKVEDSEQSMNFVTSLFYRDFWTNGILAAVSENCVSPDLQMLRCNESWVISRVYFIVLIPEYSQTTSPCWAGGFEFLSNHQTELLKSRSRWLRSSPRTADVFPVLASLPTTGDTSAVRRLTVFKTLSQFIWSYH